jgi:hypothetical protein
MKTLFALAAGLAIATSSTAMAGGDSYSGNWPLTISHSLFMNGTYCLTVTDDGSEGWTHSGEATVPEYTYGIFQVIHGKFVAGIVEPAGGQNDVLVLTSNGRDGVFDDGAAVLEAGGEPLDSGVMKVGKRGGC